VLGKKVLSSKASIKRGPDAKRKQSRIRAKEVISDQIGEGHEKKGQGNPRIKTPMPMEWKKGKLAS